MFDDLRRNRFFFIKIQGCSLLNFEYIFQEILSNHFVITLNQISREESLNVLLSTSQCQLKDYLA